MGRTRKKKVVTSDCCGGGDLNNRPAWECYSMNSPVEIKCVSKSCVLYISWQYHCILTIAKHGHTYLVYNEYEINKTLGSFVLNGFRDKAHVREMHSANWRSCWQTVCNFNDVISIAHSGVKRKQQLSLQNGIRTLVLMNWLSPKNTICSKNRLVLKANKGQYALLWACFYYT